MVVLTFMKLHAVWFSLVMMAAATPHQGCGLKGFEPDLSANQIGGFLDALVGVDEHKPVAESTV